MIIATLIAAGRLDDRLLAEALARVPGSTTFCNGSIKATRSISRCRTLARRTALEGWKGCDVVVQPTEGREKKLLAADMDSTIIGQECIDELADYAGIKPSIAAITERAMRGEIDFADALRERVALLEGLDVAIIGRCLEERIRPNPGAVTLVRTMRARGAGTLLLSGGFVDFVEPVAALVGFENHSANVLGREGNELNGELDGPIVDAEAKRSAMLLECEERGLEASAVLAIGDGANDIPLIEAAGLGVAYRAKPALAAGGRCAARPSRARRLAVGAGHFAQGLDYLAATAKQGWGFNRAQAAAASALLNGPAWRRVMAPTGT